MKKTFIAAAVIIVMSAIQSHARPGDPFTQYGCGRNTVAKGDPADKVIQYCGQPTSIEQQDRPTQTYDKRTKSMTTVGASVNYEQWLYNFGPRGGMVQMNFRNGTLVSITDKGAGYYINTQPN